MPSSQVDPPSRDRDPAYGSNKASGASSGALTLMGGTLASRLTGLLRNSLFNQLFPQTVTDAFTVAFKVPNLFRELLAEGALTNSLVPIYRGQSQSDARHLAGALAGMLLVVNAVLLLASTLVAPWVVRLLLGTEGSVDFELAVRLTRVVFPFLAAISFSALAMGVLQAEERFLGPAWAPVALNVVTVVLMLVFPAQAIPLALAFVFGATAQFLFQMPFLVRYRLLPQLGHFWHPELATVLVLMIPFAFTTSARQVLNVISTRILDTLEAGSQTAFFNADLFLGLALGLFSISPALAYYSRLSANASDEPAAFSETLLEGLRLIAFLSAPAGLLLIIIPDAAVNSVLNWVTVFRPEAGTNPRTLDLSADALAPLGLAVFPLGVANLLMRTFYIRREVRLPIAVSAIFVASSGALYTLLVPPLGIAGMSWGLAVASWCQLALLLVLVARRERFGLAAFSRYALGVWVAASLACGATYLILQVIPFASSWVGFLARALLAVGVLVAVYVLIGAAFGFTELQRFRVGRHRR
jgi:putative peptidoglycan lipid II flippase